MIMLKRCTTYTTEYIVENCEMTAAIQLEPFEYCDTSMEAETCMENIYVCIWNIIKVAETTTSRTYFGLLLHLLLLLLLLDIILFTDHTSHPPGSITNHPNLKVTCPVHVGYIYGQCKKERWNEWSDITTRFLCAKMIFYTWTVNVSHM